MRTILKALLLILALSTCAEAQTSIAVNPTSILMPTCLAGQFVTSNGSTLTCATPVASVSTVTVAGGPGISVTGGPAYVVSASFPAVTKVASYALVAADNSHTFVYNSATPGTFSFPVSGAAGFGNGWGVCVVNRGAGALTLLPAAPSVFFGGPVVLNKGQSECAQADDTGNWLLVAGVSSVVANPNTFQ